MPACNSCGDVLTPGEWKAGTCPMCGAATGARPGENSPATPAQRGDDDAATIPADGRPGWGTVRAGMAILITSLVLVWGFGAATWLSYNAIKDTSVTPPATMTTMQVSSIGLIVAIFGGVIGVLTCNGTPAGSGGRLWMIATTTCILASFALVTTTMYMQNANTAVERENLRRRYQPGQSRFSRRFGVARSSARPRPKEKPFEAATITLADKSGKTLGGVSWVFFLLFLWSVARFVQSRGLAVSTLILVVIATAFQGFYFHSVWSAESIGILRQVDTITKTPTDLSIAFVLLGFCLSIWYVGTMMALRSKIGNLLREET